MGYHVYISEVVAKPELHPQVEASGLTFWPLSDFTDQQWQELDKVFPGKQVELFGCEGIFLKECEFSTFQLPFVRVKRTNAIFTRKEGLAEYLRQEGVEETGKRLIDFFEEGKNLATIS